MPFVPVPNVAEIAFIYSYAAVPCQNSLYARKAGMTLTDLNNLASAMAVSWATNVMPLLNEDVSFPFVICRDLTTATSGIVLQALTPPATGGAGDGVGDNAEAFAVKLSTASRGRSFRGRIFIPGIPSTAKEDRNHVSADWAGLITAAVAQVVDDMGGQGFEGVVVSRFTAGEPRTTGLGTTITGVSFTDTRVDHQRKRMPAS